MINPDFVSNQRKSTDSFIQALSSGTYNFQRWDEYLNSFPVPVLMCDQSLTIINTNEAFLLSSGYKADIIKGVQVKNLNISLISGESLWDAAITGKVTSGIGEVFLPKGSGFYEIRAVPIMDPRALSMSILVFFILPDNEIRYPSYNAIRDSLSSSCEVIAETDGTILSISSEMQRFISGQSLDEKNIWNWKWLLKIKDEVGRLCESGKKNGNFIHEFNINDSCLLITIRIHDIILLKRRIIYLSIYQMSLHQQETLPEKHEDFEYSSLIKKISAHIISGEFSYRVDIKQVPENEREGFIALNSMMDKVESQYSALSEGVAQMKSGWLPSSINAPKEGPFDEIIHNLDEVLGLMQIMIATVESFTMSVMEGNLSVKGETSGLCGYYLAMVSGMNQMINQLNTPLFEIQRVAGEYAACLFSTRMDENIHYPGDFTSFKESINAIGIWCAGVVGEIDRVSSRYADGDFTAHMSSRLEVKGDFTTIRNSLDNIGIQVSESITTLRQVAGVLADEADGLKNEISVVSGQAETLATHTRAVSERSKSVHNEVALMIRSSDEAMEALSDMNEKVQEVAKRSAKTHEISAHGIDLANQSKEGIDAIIGASGSVDSGITRIHDELKNIEKIVKVVTDIANQTNLLAINAAIEAAHAGIYGKGFAVVASEVKILAVQSKESTTNISRTLEALHSAFQEVKKKVSEVQDEVQSRSFAICEMVDLFKGLIQEVEKIAAMSRETGVLSCEQERKISDLHQRALTIGRLMNETSEDANASAQACNSSFRSVEQISLHIKKVAKLSDDIHQGISGFTV